MIRFTVAQLNYTVGDIDGNVARMIAAANQAQEQRAEMVVFSELALTGYYPGDLLDDPSFVRRMARGLEALRKASRESPQLVWVFGAPVVRQGTGKRFSNSLLVVKAGEVLLHYAKQLLTTYSIFDERRHFEPGPDRAPVVKIGQSRIGFMICEDGWNDAGPDHDANPFHRMVDAAPDLVISINASPSDIGKRELRHLVFARACKRYGLPLLYINQIGGQGQFVFDGASFAIEPEAGVVFEARRFDEDIASLCFDNGRFMTTQGASPAPVSAKGLSMMAFYQAQIVLGLRDYARRCDFQKAVVGVSGGIDSALTLTLAVDALGADNVLAVTLPAVTLPPGHASARSVDDSVVLCKNLGVRLHIHPIADLVSLHQRQFEASAGQPLQGAPLANLQARIRGSVLMSYSNEFGQLLLTTGNKSELSIGQCTLYGDAHAGLALIGDLYKTEVFALARHLNTVAGRPRIPGAIIDRTPPAEMVPSLKDADKLPPFTTLDEILRYVVDGERLARSENDRTRRFMTELRAQPQGQALIHRIRQLVARNEYKRRQSPPIIRVRARAFGAGRQMPLAAYFEEA